MARVVALCPSRGRPERAVECLRSFEATRKDPATRLVFVVDADDPTRKDYPGEVYVTKPTGSYAGALNAAAKDRALIGDATALGFVGDDVRFVTPGWDVTLGDWLEENTGIAWGDDGWEHPWPKESKASHWWVSKAIVDVFGLAPAGLKHFYPDDFWAELGWAAGCARYFPDVLIEHLHPMAGKGGEDAIYERAGKHAARDRQTFHQWQRRFKARDVSRLMAISQKKSREHKVVFADWHHPALWESLRILFEERFGWTLVSPIGREWENEGFRFVHEDWKAEDYLIFPKAKLAGDHYELTEAEYPDHKRKLVTVEQAKAMRPDIVMATVAAHRASFAELAKKWGARFVYQVGNAKQTLDVARDTVILASAKLPRFLRRYPHIIQYHQEFDQRVWAYSKPETGTRVASFMLRMDTASGPYQWLEKAPGISWYSYGGKDQRANSYLAPMTKVAAEMRKAGWVWHDKKIGDGYGHVLHNAAAMGRPLIGHASHYAGLLGEPYWKDLKTCIDLDRHDPETALRLIKAIASNPEWHADMSRRIREEFDARVNFDAEAAQIRTVLA